MADKARDDCEIVSCDSETGLCYCVERDHFVSEKSASQLGLNKD